jgi:hypothetical protein
VLLAYHDREFVVASTVNKEIPAEEMRILVMGNVDADGRWIVTDFIRR